ncbi:MAG: alcohol dehydrogenase catalytic domain-containing protein [Eubacteriales bacterium]|nr:alcohol dehydrogenase catalytic domain-containing protein [Eubacteriales bacterium]
MKAVRLFGKNDIRVVDMDLPAPGYGQALVKVECCGICGTDYAILNGAFSGMVDYPITMGHEWSGEVAETGPGVTHVQKGDRVAGDTCVSCGNCYACLTGNYINCKTKKNVGTTMTWDGAYAEYILFPARHLFKLPDNVDFDSGALLEPAATAMLAVVQARVGLGDNVVVHGTGPIGISAALLAKLSGAAKVMITGRKDFKLKLAKEMGVDYTVNTARQDMAGMAHDIFKGEGADAVIEASGSEMLMKDSFEIVANSARISVVSFFEKNVNLDIDTAVFKDVSILPVPGNRGMNMPALRLMASGRLNLKPLITGRCRLSDVPDVLNNLKTDNEKKIKIMIDCAI